MGLLDWLGIGKTVENIVGTVANKIAGDKASESEKITAQEKSTASAREMQSAIGETGKITNNLRQYIRIIGGHFSQGIIFFNIICPYFGLDRVPLTKFDYSILLTIITYFYGSRYFEVRGGRRT